MVSAALGLVGLGETGYGELVAGGLALGVGTEKNAQKAVAWLDYTATEIEAGAPPVSQDAGVERAAILRLVSTELPPPRPTAAARSCWPATPRRRRSSRLR